MKIQENQQQLLSEQKDNTGNNEFPCIGADSIMEGLIQAADNVTIIKTGNGTLTLGNGTGTGTIPKGYILTLSSGPSPFSTGNKPL